MEARDGKDDTSRAPFLFTTEPEVNIKDTSIEYRWWEGAGGYGIVAYFELTAVENATSYFLEIIEHVPQLIPSIVARTYSWKPDDVLPTGNNVDSGASILTEFTPGIYHANTTTGSGPMSVFSDAQSFFEVLEGRARVNIVVGSED